MVVSKDGDTDQHINDQERSADSVARTTVSPPRSEDDDMSDVKSTSLSSRSYLKSASISASKCVVATKKHPEVMLNSTGVASRQGGTLVHYQCLPLFDGMHAHCQYQGRTWKRTSLIDLLHASCTFSLIPSSTLGTR